MNSTKEELQKSCKNIAEFLENIADGNVLICPECENEVDKEDAEIEDDEDDVGSTRLCPECGEEMRQKEMSDWLTDVLDFNFVIDRQGRLRDSEVCVGFGGPNIWVKTDGRGVYGYWGADEAYAGITGEVCDQINDAMEEIYECTK
jgi:endogenous inhibitor of DNA gyrase (YacG/DUF329 family)